MPFYVRHMRDILEEAGIPDVKGYRIRVDQYVQEILGTRDQEPEAVWALLQTKLKDPAYKEWFVRELSQRWQQRDWRKEGL